MEEIPKTTGIIYDAFLMKHKCRRKHPEKPQRVQAIINQLGKQHYLTHPTVQYIDSIKRKATNQELQMAHPAKYVKHIQNLWPKTSHRTDMTVLDSYYNQFTDEVSRTAVGGLLDVTDKLLDSQCTWENAFAVIRPPGHHSGSRNTINGFCVYNNVAVAAEYLIKKHNLKRVMVLDWDVHHGNGTQQLFLKQSNVLFFSSHRYDYGTFYPSTEFGDYNSNGEGPSQGMHVNIPMNYVDKKFKQYSFQAPGDNQYIYFYHRIIEPIVRSYNPEFIIISSGFDAARNDPLGGFTVTPNGYYYLTRKLKDLAKELGMKNKNEKGKSRPIPLMMVLQGGYNLVATKDAAAGVVRALVDDQQFPEKQSFQVPISYNELKHYCSLESLMHEQFDIMIEHYSKVWPVLQQEKMKKFTELIKKNKQKRFGKVNAEESSSQSSEGQVDDNQNEDRPKKKLSKTHSKESHPKEKAEMKQLEQEEIKQGTELTSIEPIYPPNPIKEKKKSKPKSQTEKLIEDEEPNKQSTNQFYFAAGHMQRFKNFSLENPNIYKWAYDNQIRFYQVEQLQEKQFIPKYYGKDGSYIIIENLLYKQKDPIIMDIKLSRISKNEEFDIDKREKEKKKEVKSTSDKYSFRISGYTTPQFKQGGLLTNDEQAVRKMLKKVVYPDNKDLFVNFLTAMSEKMRTINRRYFGTSIVLIRGTQKSMIRWVDFHHWIEQAQGYDQDLVQGIDNLIMFINSLTFDS